jgi:hypothetical protein
MGVINAMAVDRPSGVRLYFVSADVEKFEAPEEDLPDVTVLGWQGAVPGEPLRALPRKRKFYGPTFINVGIVV